VPVHVLYVKVLDACNFMENGTQLASSSPRCENNGACVNGSRSDSLGSFSCVCATGYTGQYCQQSTTGHHHFVIRTDLNLAKMLKNTSTYVLKLSCCFPVVTVRITDPAENTPPP